MYAPICETLSRKFPLLLYYVLVFSLKPLWSLLNGLVISIHVSPFLRARGTVLSVQMQGRLIFLILLLTLDLAI